MKLAVLIAALCTASCTAITLAAGRPKPQLQRANKVLALRGGSSIPCSNPMTAWCKPTSSCGSLGLFGDCMRASDGLLGVFLWSSLYIAGSLNILPGKVGKYFQHLFLSIYKKEGELAYIRFEILWILSAVANTAVLLFTLDHSELVKRCSTIWAITFTLVVIKFQLEYKEGLIGLKPKEFVGVQAFHIVFALGCLYGVIRGSAA